LNSALTVCRHTVSGSFSLPSRGAFHLSLTVLFAIGCQVVFSLGRWSSLLPAGFHVSSGTRGLHSRALSFSLTRLSLPMAWLSIQVQLMIWFVTLRLTCNLVMCSPQPQLCNACRLSHTAGLGCFPVRSPLLRESLLISFPPVTKMFQFTGSGFFCPIYSGSDNTCSQVLGSPIRISTDLCSLAAPRSFSQLAASFFASWHQGIPRTPFVS